jgi:hypothetical protein
MGVFLDPEAMSAKAAKRTFHFYKKTSSLGLLLAFCSLSSNWMITEIGGYVKVQWVVSRK